MLQWAERLKGSPKQPYFHAAALAGRKLYSFGGWHDRATNGDQMVVHVFDTESLRWAKLPPEATGGLDEVPPMRYGHTATLLADDLIYVWGGYPYSDALYLYAVGGDRPRWSKPRSVAGTPPSAREGHAACALGGVMYVHGGWNQTTGYSDDLHKMDATSGKQRVWSRVLARGLPPPATYCHSATAIGINKMLVFGGVGDHRRGDGRNGAVWVFDAVEGHWLNPVAAATSSSSSSSTPTPRRRWCHAAFARHGFLYIFGGRDAGRYFGDLWRFNPETLRWRRERPKRGAGAPPGPTCRMCCCVLPGEDRVLLFGGCVGNASATDEMHVLDFVPSLRTLSRLAVARLYVVSVGRAKAAAPRPPARRPEPPPPAGIFASLSLAYWWFLRNVFGRS